MTRQGSPVSLISCRTQARNGSAFTRQSALVQGAAVVVEVRVVLRAGAGAGGARIVMVSPEGEPDADFASS